MKKVSKNKDNPVQLKKTDKIYYVNRVPVTYYEIECWWNAACLNEKVGLKPPWECENSCYRIAWKIFGQNMPPSQPVPVQAKIDLDGWRDPTVVSKILRAMRDAQNKQNAQTYKSRIQEPPPPPPPPSWKKVLGIPEYMHVTENVLKEYFRKAAKDNHPDRQGGDERRMKEVLDARDRAVKELGWI
jgi:hypothetical protein